MRKACSRQAHLSGGWKGLQIVGVYCSKDSGWATDCLLWQTGELKPRLQE